LSRNDFDVRCRFSLDSACHSNIVIAVSQIKFRHVLFSPYLHSEIVDVEDWTTVTDCNCVQLDAETEASIRLLDKEYL
jgi:hypothetical protein